MERILPVGGLGPSPTRRRVHAPEAQYLPYGRHGALTVPEYRAFLNANFADMERSVLARISEFSDPYTLSLFAVMCQERADEEGAHWLYSALTQI